MASSRTVPKAVLRWIRVKYIPFLPLDLDCTRSISLEPLHLCYEMNCVVTSNVALTRTIEATDFMPPGLRAAV